MQNEKGNHVVFRTQLRGDGSKTVEVHTPEMTLPIHNKDELEAQLKHYAKLLLGLTVSNTMSAKRKYVELVRPALRYYCKKFNVEQPKWLASDDYYTKTMSASERQRHFGTSPLRIGEFQQLKKVDSIVGVNYPGKEKNPAEEEAKAKANGKPQPK